MNKRWIPFIRFWLKSSRSTRRWNNSTKLFIKEKKPERWKNITFLRLFLLVSCIVLVISYLSFYKMVFIPKDAMMGKEKLTAFARRVREDLIKTENAKPFHCKTEDGIDLNGLSVERENAVGTMIFCHGYRCCKELTAEYVKMFPDYNTILFDFRAHGENKRSITTIGCHEYKDVLAITDWLKNNKPKWSEKPLVILGVSMGGASALEATAQNPDLCDALIVDSTFSNLKSILYRTFVNKSGLPVFPFFYVMGKMFNYLGSCDLNKMVPLEAVKKIKKPLLLIHSCVDNFVPVQESLLMYAQGEKTGAKLWIAPKCKHGWLHQKYPDLYKRKIEKFLKKKVFNLYPPSDFDRTPPLPRQA